MAKAKKLTAKQRAENAVRVKKLNDMMLYKFDGLMVTYECLSEDQIQRGVLRVADYGTACEYGTTYFVGNIDEVEKYVNGLP